MAEGVKGGTARRGERGRDEGSDMDAALELGEVMVAHVARTDSRTRGGK